MEEEKRIELKDVPGFKEDDWAVIKKYSFREKTKLRGKCIFLDNDNQPKVDVGELQFWSAVYGLKQASFIKDAQGQPEQNPSTEAKRDVLEAMGDEGDYLFQEIAAFNNLDETKVMQKK